MFEGGVEDSCETGQGREYCEFEFWGGTGGDEEGFYVLWDETCCGGVDKGFGD